MKLSKRLHQLDAMVANDYQHVWDCCCDHGFLGAALLTRQAAPHIHFVDIVPGLMAQLDEKLQRFYPDNRAYQTHCLDVSQLPLESFPGHTLVIIAGVGGELMSRFIADIHGRHPEITIDWLLCPTNQTFHLRSCLIDLGFSLNDEVLLEENQRYYEILSVTSTGTLAPARDNRAVSAISPVGAKLWQTIELTSKHQTQLAERYRDNLLKHYQRVNQASDTDVGHIIAAYKNAPLAQC
ncbi:MAG: tRNA (adenine(22)-N(1))-methyltransferase [Shewanella sp.]